MPIDARRNDDKQVMKWRCQERGCSYIKEKYKPGAHVGAKSVMRCPNCSENTLFELEEKGDSGGIPNT
jgi:hypothetical protein